MTLLKCSQATGLARLRIILLAAAALLLVAAIVLANLAWHNWQQAVVGVMPVQTVVAPEVIANRVVQDQLEVVASYEMSQPNAAATEPPDPNREWNERTAAAVGNFIRTYGLEGDTFDKPQLMQALRVRATQWGGTTHGAEFAQGLAVTTEQTLNDPRLLQLFETPTVKLAAAPPQGRRYQGSPTNVVNDLLETYALTFAAALEKQPVEKAQAAFEAASAKASAMTQIVIAASALGVCLMLVFIAIALRLEQAVQRNLHARSGTVL